LRERSHRYSVAAIGIPSQPSAFVWSWCLVPNPSDHESLDQGRQSRASRPRLCTLTEDEGGVVLGCDDAFTRMFGYAREEVIGKHVLDHVHADDQARAVEGWLQMLSTRSVQQIRLRRRHKDGGWLWVESTVQNHLHGGDRNHVLVEIIDVSAEMAAQRELEEREELLRCLLEAMPDGVLQVDADRNVVFYNSRLLEILGAPAHAGPHPDRERAHPDRKQVHSDREQAHPDREQRETAFAGAGSGAPDASATSLSALLASATAQSSAVFEMALAQTLDEGIEQDVELELVLAVGKTRGVLMSIRPLLLGSGEITGAVSTALEITDNERSREQLARRGALDPVTGCHDRTSILSALQRELGGPRRDETAVILVDLDSFKSLDEELGNARADEAFVKVLDRLKAASRSADRIGRSADDQFLLVIRGMPQPEVALGLAQRVSESMRIPLELSRGRVQLPVSLGVAFAGNEALTAAQLFERAEVAMRHSKQALQGAPALAGAQDRC
jgi:diguanylate cyclase (GGDEF)-like protein/PAS domain S-box-containing protein